VLVAAALLVIAGLGGCVAALVVGGPCAFDPPPGDVGEFRVVDDGAAPVTLFACDDGTCRSGFAPEPVAAGGTRTSSFELCNRATIGVTDEAGFLRGCLVLPVGEDRPEPTFRVSQFDASCAGAGDVRPRIS
jgi:hypothetical protein